jgi:GDP-L-fucose synthase
MHSHINVGFGSDMAIAKLAQAIKEAVGYAGKIGVNASKLDGSPRKWIDSSKLKKLGWEPKVDLASGIRLAYGDFKARSV